MRYVSFLSLIYLTFQAYKEKFQFNLNSEFVILLMTDLHFGEDATLDEKTAKLQDKLIGFIRPDLVVITGDSVGGWNWNRRPNWYFPHWQNFTNVFSERKTPYAFTLGNHDPEADLSSKDIINLDQTHEYSVMKYRGQENNGTSNYHIPIFSNLKDNYVSYNLWLFDSMSRTCEGMVISYGCVTYKQIEWYNQLSKNLSNNSFSSYGSAFMHIPPTAVKTLYNFFNTTGTKAEPFSCPRLNTCLFNNITQTGNIQNIFFGHDHDNDFHGIYKDVLLKYCRKTGFGNYGPKERKKGATVIKLKEITTKKGNIKVTTNFFTINEDNEVENMIEETPENKRKELNCFYDTQGGTEEDPCGIPEEWKSMSEEEDNQKDNGKTGSLFIKLILVTVGILMIIFCCRSICKKRRIMYTPMESSNSFR